MRSLRSILPAVVIFGTLLVVFYIADRQSSFADAPAPLTCDELVERSVKPPTDPRVVRVVRVNCDDLDLEGVGTGWVSPNHRVVTARHVVLNDGDARNVYVLTTERTLHASAITLRDGLDVAVIDVDRADRLPTPLNISRSPTSQVGSYMALGHHDESYTLAAALTPQGISRNTDNGIVNVYRGNVLPGFSGGPVLNDQDRVVGITYAKGEDEPFALVVPVESVADLLTPAT